MERNFDNRDFEQYLKKNADQYKMYPSEKVWEEIHSSLHPRRRWAGIAALLLLITGAIVTTVMMLGPGSIENKNTVQQPALSNSTEQKANSPIQKHNNPSENLLKDINQAKPIAANRIPSIIPDNDNNIYTEPAADVILSINEPTVFVSTTNETNKQDFQIENITVATKIETISRNYYPSPLVAEAAKPDESNIQQKASATVKTNKQNTVLLLSLVQNKPVPNSAKPKEKKKIAFQLYFTPGVSYRRLSENKEAILAASGGPAIPTNLALEDVENVVTHKPDMGFELGLAAKYPLSKRISVKAGLQFNVNKYDIRAFSYSGEPATIAIQDGGSSQQTLTRTSYYRNSSGYRPNWLTNVYFSFSAPIGAEIKVLTGKKLDLGFGITGQPTYLLDNRAYMISTDYKNYVKVPDLIRRWNINTGAELIVSIKSKRTIWQIGPQFRYQTLSSFKDKYPVKENLSNFGFKAGILLNQ
jgi:hypothetical protein